MATGEDLVMNKFQLCAESPYQMLPAGGEIVGLSCDMATRDRHIAVVNGQATKHSIGELAVYGWTKPIL